ncbi:M23 family metallopeptidase [Exiguobacterium sp. SL-9]|nr:M23 family metallopeptidase [Exiguobacterium sp. SL-9]
MLSPSGLSFLYARNFMFLTPYTIGTTSKGGTYMQLDVRTFPKSFLDGQFDSIYSQTTDSFKQQTSLDTFYRLATSFNEGVRRYRVINDMKLNGSRHLVWMDDRKERMLSVTFNQDELIEELLMTPHQPDSRGDRRFTKHTYHLPFTDDWLVLSGGTHPGENRHYPERSQRYAYDFIKVNNNWSYNKSKSGNHSFYAFGERVITPLDGTVVVVVDDVPDVPDSNHPFGNHVILEHAGGEYSLLAHLEAGSIAVNVGDRLKTRQLIGRCGNSGDLSEPHLHFQVMDSPNLASATSIRIRLKGRKKPVRGHIVRPKLSNLPNRTDLAADFLFELALAVPRLLFNFWR